MQCLERQARGAAAWGFFGAVMRQQHFNREIADHNEQVRVAGSEENKARAKAARTKFVQDCRGDHTLHIGPY